MKNCYLPKYGLMWVWISVYTDQSQKPVYEESLGHNTIHYDSESNVWLTHYKRLVDTYEKDLIKKYPHLGIKVIMSHRLNRSL